MSDRLRSPIGALALGRDYLIAQFLAKSTAFVTSLLVVRWLGVDQYATYTLLLTGFSLVSAATDLGLTGTLPFFFGQKKTTDSVPQILAVSALHQRFFIGSSVLVAAFLFYSGARIDLSVFDLVAPFAMVLIAGWLWLRYIVQSMLLRLTQQFRKAYALELASEGAKLVFVICIIQFLPIADYAFTAILVGAFTAVLLGSRLGQQRIDLPSAEELLRLESQVIRQASPRFPSSIYFVLQIALLPTLAATFASQQALAEIGALARIGILVTVTAGFFSQVVVPLLVPIKSEGEFWRPAFSWLLIILAGGVGFLLICWLMPNLFLLLLGNNYGGLYEELLVAMTGVVVAAGAAFMVELQRLRGWVKGQSLEIIFILGAQIIVGSLVDLSLTISLLWVALAGSLSSFFFQGAGLALRFLRFRGFGR